MASLSGCLLFSSWCHCCSILVLNLHFLFPFYPRSCPWDLLNDLGFADRTPCEPFSVFFLLHPPGRRGCLLLLHPQPHTLQRTLSAHWAFGLSLYLKGCPGRSPHSFSAWVLASPIQSWWHKTISWGDLSMSIEVDSRHYRKSENHCSLSAKHRSTHILLMIKKR